jgi:hypothetical protein
VNIQLSYENISSLFIVLMYLDYAFLFSSARGSCQARDGVGEYAFLGSSCDASGDNEIFIEVIPV